MSAPKEIWKTIQDTNGKYFVSNFGNVKSIRKHLKKCLNGFGYLVVNIRYDGKTKTRKVHQLVGEAFLSKEDGLVINHIDGRKINNCVDNLGYCTQSENLKHSYSIGLSKPVINIEGRNGFSKNVIDKKTGIIYDSLTQVVRLKIVDYSYTALRAMISGQNHNKTSLNYI